MIDINVIRNNKELVRENIKKKFQDNKLPLVDEIVELDEKVRKLKIEGDNLRQERNNVSSEIGLLMREKRVDEANSKKENVVKILRYHINVNDKTIEGIRHKILPAYGVQYNPAVFSGNAMLDRTFDEFMKLYEEGAEK